ncbi:MAG: hypothetical protein DMG40_15290 [Acidobacteria bacterium]|nr:MAG: hypothetical protein DMG40_15290 [Acidobacteriota bacterium]
MLAEETWNLPTVLVVGARQLLLDNLRVLLRTLGFRCVIGASLKEARALVDKEKPYAALLDQQLLKSTTAEILATLHRLFFRLQGRAALLTDKDSDPQLLKMLDAYSLPKVSVDLVFQELWPCLDSLFRRNIAPTKQNARLVFDSFLEPLPAGIRSALPADRTLLYEAGDVTVDLWLESQSDLRRAKLMGQILSRARPASQKSYPVMLQSETEPIAATTSNTMGEFQLDFDSHTHMKLEIAVRERHWVSLELPDSLATTQEIED